MAETDRRRKIQIAANEAQGITPKTIRKQVRDIMEGARHDRQRAAAESTQGRRAGYFLCTSVTPEQALKDIVGLEKQMMPHARDLEFEEAARIRDQIDALRRNVLGVAEPG